MKTKINLLLVLLVFTLQSCNDHKTEIEFASTYPVSGTWYLTYEYAGDNYEGNEIMIYNTAFSRDSVWIDDGGFLEVKVKAGVNQYRNIFTAEEEGISIKGKIIGKDSIYLQAIFTYEEDPNDTIIGYGHRFTGFEEE